MRSTQADIKQVPQQAPQFTVPTGSATAVAPALPTNMNGATVGQAWQAVIVQSIGANTAKVYVGGAGVTVTTGLELNPGDSVSLPVGDPSTIFAISGTSGQILHVVWV